MMLQPYDLIFLSASNRQLRRQCLEQSVWELIYDTLLAGKVTRRAVEMQSLTQSISLSHSYFQAIRDSKRNVFVSADELCSIRFAFRFKLLAGDDWILRDPSWQLQTEILQSIAQPRPRPFWDNLDGLSATEVAAISAGLLQMPRKYGHAQGNGHPSLNFSTEIAVASSRTMVVQFVKDTPTSGWIKRLTSWPLDRDIKAAFPKVRWRFCKSRLGVRGQYVQVRRWPSMRIQRTPDWGWQLDSCWVRYRTHGTVTEGLTRQWLDDRLRCSI